MPWVDRYDSDSSLQNGSFIELVHMRGTGEGWLVS